VQFTSTGHDLLATSGRVKVRFKLVVDTLYGVICFVSLSLAGQLGLLGIFSRKEKERESKGWISY